MGGSKGSPKGGDKKKKGTVNSVVDAVTKVMRKKETGPEEESRSTDGSQKPGYAGGFTSLRAMRGGDDPKRDIRNEVLEARQLEEQTQNESSTDDVEIVGEYREVRKAEKRTRQEGASDEGALTSAQGSSPQEKVKVKKSKKESGPKITEDIVLKKKKTVGKETLDLRGVHKISEVEGAVSSLFGSLTRRVERLAEQASSNQHLSVLQKREVRAILQDARELEKGVKQCAALRQELDLELVEGLKFIREMRQAQESAIKTVVAGKNGGGEVTRRPTFATVAKTGTTRAIVHAQEWPKSNWLEKPTDGLGEISAPVPTVEGEWQTVAHRKAAKATKKKPKSVEVT
ncbi:hypothetical protein KPH14_011915, partial [Odynerus spinipes]